MTEEQIRALVRDVLARVPSSPRAVPMPDRTSPLPAGPLPPAAWKTHLSHGRFVFLAPAEPDAPCVVEPQVRCHHCGFCQSYGH